MMSDKTEGQQKVHITQCRTSYIRPSQNQAVVGTQQSQQRGAKQHIKQIKCSTTSILV